MSMGRRRRTGVYWGRFNPPHMGHLAMIRRFRRRCRLIVAIGSSEHYDELTNPFRGSERRRMLESYLEEMGICDVRVVALNDGASEGWALENLLKKCSPDLLFLSDERETLAALAEGKVAVVRFRRTGTVSSTAIRRKIASGDPDWKRMTGNTVVRLIEKYDGPARIRRSFDRAKPTERAGRAAGRS